MWPRPLWRRTPPHGPRPGQPPPQGARRHPAVPPLLTLAAALAGAVYLWRTNPEEDGHLLPRCPFNWATGLDCPGCGATRMTYHLLHADLPAALHANAALLLLGLPLALWLFTRWLTHTLRARRPYRPPLDRPRTTAILAAAVLWAIARNVAT